MRFLINELSKLPSVGERSATRLAYHLLANDRNLMKSLAESLFNASEKILLCRYCFFFSDSDICSFCQDKGRVDNLLCVVEKPADVIALESSGGYRGLYHVLHGVWSPLKGIGPEKTKIAELLFRLCKEDREEGDPLQLPVEEIIIATSTTVEGDATALYISNVLSGSNIKISRIAQGLPKGGELEYADQLTINSAINGRRII